MYYSLFHRLSPTIMHPFGSKVDGFELNVTAGSKDRLVSFVKGLKDEMANKSLDRMILLALPTKPEDLAKQFELKELSKYVCIIYGCMFIVYLNDSCVNKIALLIFTRGG